MVRRLPRRKTRSLCAGLILLGMAAGISIFSTGPAHAQGFFDSLSNLFGGRAVAPEVEAPAGPVVAYCVRLCDGRYFPMAKNIGAPHSSPEKICGALCPAASTRIFTGSQIEQARASNGDLYTKLQNALVYRERMVAGCSCTGKDGTGNAAMDARSDPTLLAGDIVVTADGPMVFNGKGSAPHQPGAFTAAKNHSGLPADLRRQVSAMRISPTERVAAQEGTPPATISSRSPLVLTINPINPIIPVSSQ